MNKEDKAILQNYAAGRMLPVPPKSVCTDKSNLSADSAIAAESLLEKLEKIENLELLTLNCNDGISLEVTKVTPRIARDFVKYQSIAESGKVYIPHDTDKISTAAWFINRGCIVNFSLNHEMEINWIDKWLMKMKAKQLNKQILHS